MKKLIAALILSAFTAGAFAASVNPVMQQDTTKKTKNYKTKKDTSMKKDTTKKPVKK